MAILEHRVIETWEGEGSLVCRGEVTYTKSEDSRRCHGAGRQPSGIPEYLGMSSCNAGAAGAVGSTRASSKFGSMLIAAVREPARGRFPLAIAIVCLTGRGGGHRRGRIRSSLH